MISLKTFVFGFIGDYFYKAPDYERAEAVLKWFDFNNFLLGTYIGVTEELVLQRGNFCK